jgi:ADP-ribosyl-[dinitrogen reductase] hydrolase
MFAADCLVARVLLKSINRSSTGSSSAANGFDAVAFRSDYITFMTTPGSHSDTYAGTCHRMFFANWSKGVPPADCPGNDGHNVDAIDGELITQKPNVLSVHLQQ